MRDARWPFDSPDAQDPRAGGVAAGRRSLTERLGEPRRRRGQPLPAAARTQFEASLGTDLGAVQVHDDPASHAAAAALDARAFAVGDDVHFAAGAYQPDDPFGQHLLAHEVAHTAQQRGAAPIGQAKAAASSPGDAAEVEADRAADAMVLGLPATVSPLGRAAVQRNTGAGAAPVAAASAPAAPTAAAVSGDEAAPVKLPEAGALGITFSSSERQTQLDVDDLRSLDLGRGRLLTEPLPVGEFLSLQAELGADAPMTLTKPTFTLSPVVGTISAGEVDRARTRDAQVSTAGRIAGGIAAAHGGVLGGLLAPLVGRDPISGARDAGAAAGGAVTGLLQQYAGERHLCARLDQGEVRADLGLVYNPYVALNLSATGLSWLANAHAWLQTHLTLSATAAASLAGSELRLVFRDGTLQRTEFTLRPAMRFALTLAGHAGLQIGATLLPILSGPGVPHVDEGALQGNLILPPFELGTITAEVNAGTELALSKGSPLHVLRRAVSFPARTARDQFSAQLRASAGRMPLRRQRGGLDRQSRTGRTQADAIPMIWAKPFSAYPDYLTWEPMSTTGRRRIPKWPFNHHSAGWEAGPSMGVDSFPAVGTRVLRTGTSGDRPGVARWRAEAERHRVDLSELGYDVDIDHVLDLEFGGEDEAHNLWPLERSSNRAAGNHNKQRVWWSPSPGEAPRRNMILGTPYNLWFEIDRIDSGLRADDGG
jgi:hypothetical protein